MAQNESDREDLMAEATALRRRVELQVSGETEHVISGFRDNGRFSLYFGPDPVYHFDEEGGLRRAYLDGKLYRTQGTTLARLTRNRTDQATQLKRYDLSETELQEFLKTMRCRLQNLKERIDTNQVTTVQLVSKGEPILPELATALNGILTTEKPLAPAIKAKR